VLNRKNLQVLVVLMIGTAAGYAAATSILNPFRPARAASTGTSNLPKTEQQVCCANDLSRSRMLALASRSKAAPGGETGKRPNIVFIMADDVGWFNIGAYHRGIMAGRTPHLDRLAAQGMLFTDYYAEASCTAGRANFITGELPIRTGHDRRPGRLSCPPSTASTSSLATSIISTQWRTHFIVITRRR
jgi:hypothetical protein